uniref:G_PROTEIN_RECEP_F1_2 domain-containing protein n=1 Tax=Caenorhabditis tropicalis TaxID=1561998 RepID=A0A1I7UKX8_9PELO
MFQTYPKLISGFSSLPNFAIYTLNPWFLLMAGVAIIGGLFCGAVFTLSTIDMFRMLKSVESKISTTNYKRHRAAVKSLLAQFSVTSLCLAPPFLFVLVIMSNFRYAQVTVQFLLTVFASHSSVNAVVLVITTPPYRNYVLRKPIRSQMVIKVSVGANSVF